MKLSEIGILAERLSQELKAKAKGSRTIHSQFNEDKRGYKVNAPQVDSNYREHTGYSSPNKVGP
jgi:hypothetical protein